MDDEIRKLQFERKQVDGKLAKFGAAGGYDDDFYGGQRKPRANDEDSNYVSSISVNDDYDEDEAVTLSSSKKSFLNSFTGPKQFFEDTRPKDDFDPMKELRRKTVGEKENDYQARWRKRRLSPQRFDPFDPKSKPSASNQSYRDAMIETQLEKEKQEVLFKIQEKQKKEEEERIEAERRRKRDIRKQEKREKKEKKKKRKSGWDQDNDDINNNNKDSSKKERGDDSSDDDEQAKQSKKEESDGQWRIAVLKNNEKITEMHLDPDITYQFGRGDQCDIKLEHASCSKNHAKISFSSNRPQLMDLNSTNGTKLNGRDVTAGQWYKLAENDVIQFGCSTREYRVKC